MSSMNRRVVITGMSVNTPLGDTLDAHLAGLLAGRSAVTHWRSFDAIGIYSKIGADLAGYDINSRLDALMACRSIPDAVIAKARRIAARAPWSVGLCMPLCVDAWADAGLFDTVIEDNAAATIVGGHNIQSRYRTDNLHTFNEEPDYIDALYAVHSHDTTHIGCVSDVLQLRGTGMLVGAACATGLYAVRSAIDEIRWHGAPAALVVCPVADVSPIDMHAMALIGAISQERFNDQPERASRPFDVGREGFVPGHGCGALVVEELDHALGRGARIYAEILGVETGADASYMPAPSEAGGMRVMRRVLASTGIAPDQIDYINGHFTSTPLGDLAEISAIKRVFGGHGVHLKANATKSMLGHTMISSALVELIGAVLQMRAGRLHPTINIDNLDPAVDIDVCANTAIEWPVRYLMKMLRDNLDEKSGGNRSVKRRPVAKVCSY
jgi:3-oxoacyl-(acyl-carrier-protein) synthase